MVFAAFSTGNRILENEILILANAYKLKQKAIDSLIEKVDEDYDGYLEYDKFVNFLEELDPKLMEPDKPDKSKENEEGKESPIKHKDEDQSD